MLLACIAAFFIYALHAPAALPHDATGAMLRSASTYLVLATALFACQLAAAFELVTLIRRMLAMLDAMADAAGRIVAASSRVSHTQLAELETGLDAIKVFATDADVASHDCFSMSTHCSGSSKIFRQPNDRRRRFEHFLDNERPFQHASERIGESLSALPALPVSNITKCRRSFKIIASYSI
ncbi:hypothetical protein [Burkholderia sp. A2]|uniref:hypothetical protein n=1 Tax=Burkholderia sp. A2 TaxID=236253 RepID=UPI00210CA729|nr:hypothetical protein [Burkholderia sp. A2]